MTEMINRVASSVIASRDGVGISPTEDFRVIVRAVIEAMRAPTAEMLNFGVSNKDAKRTWELMIDAALRRSP